MARYRNIKRCPKVSKCALGVRDAFYSAVSRARALGAAVRAAK
jgi:hypothetical protein